MAQPLTAFPMSLSLRLGELREKRMLLGALLVIATLVLYLPVLHHEFIQGWDDDGYVTDNPHVRSGLKWENVTWAFTSLEQSNWHPLTWLSHMLDCQLFGLNSGAHHFVNVVLHATNVLLLFWILQKATNEAGLSFFVALFFAVHPMNVESVAWVAQRKTLLSAFFTFLTIAAYAWYVQRGGWKRYLVMLGAFALASMSKPMAVSVPLLLLLIDDWPLNRLKDVPLPNRLGRLVAEKLPMLLISAASSVITMRAQPVVPLSALPLSVRLESAAISYVTYLWKIFWPAKLGPLYPHPAWAPGLSVSLGDAIASTIILFGITTVALYLHRARYLVVGWLFFLISLVPTIGIVQVGYQGMADRYTYLPNIGIFVLVVWGVVSVIRDVQIPRFVGVCAGLCLALGLAGATVRYLDYWQNGLKLFSYARATWGHPDPNLEQLYATGLLSAGRVDEALLHYKESCELQPRGDRCHYSIGQILFDRHEYRDAFTEYQVALSVTANKGMALHCINRSAESLLRLGNYAAAQQSNANALTLDPANPTALQLREQLNRMRNP